MASGAVMSDRSDRPLPGLQATMAQHVVAGEVAYSAATARWYVGDQGEVATHERGRTLRELRRAGVIEVVDDVPPDARGALPVRLTSAGQARYRPPSDDPAE